MEKWCVFLLRCSHCLNFEGPLFTYSKSCTSAIAHTSHQKSSEWSRFPRFWLHTFVFRRKSSQQHNIGNIHLSIIPWSISAADFWWNTSIYPSLAIHSWGIHRSIWSFGCRWQRSLLLDGPNSTPDIVTYLYGNMSKWFAELAQWASLQRRMCLQLLHKFYRLKNSYRYHWLQMKHLRLIFFCGGSIDSISIRQWQVGSDKIHPPSYPWFLDREITINRGS